MRRAPGPASSWRGSPPTRAFEGQPPPPATRSDARQGQRISQVLIVSNWAAAPVLSITKAYRANVMRACAAPRKWRGESRNMWHAEQLPHTVDDTVRTTSLQHLRACVSAIVDNARRGSEPIAMDCKFIAVCTIAVQQADRAAWGIVILACDQRRITRRWRRAHDVVRRNTSCTWNQCV